MCLNAQQEIEAGTQHYTWNINAKFVDDTCFLFSLFRRDAECNAGPIEL